MTPEGPQMVLSHPLQSILRNFPQGSSSEDLWDTRRTQLNTFQENLSPSSEETLVASCLAHPLSTNHSIPAAQMGLHRSSNLDPGADFQFVSGAVAVGVRATPTRSKRYYSLTRHFDIP